MQIKIFTIPAIGGEALNEEMNVFLRSKKVLETEHQLVNHEKGSFWCFCIKYLDGQLEGRESKKVDYRQVLDEATFQRFSKLREIRKQIAANEAVPPYVVFTDEELAELARMDEITISSMKKVKGIGEKKVEKYGQYFLTKPADEKS